MAAYLPLSKGIHEYEEDECYELYPAMRTIILLMLENYLSDKESKQQLKEIEKTLIIGLASHHIPRLPVIEKEPDVEILGHVAKERETSFVDPNNTP